MEASVETPQRRCQNCGAPMLGDHCYACGQPVKGLVRHFGSILGDFFDSVFDLDSRLLRTLGPLLFKPGSLSLEYFAGHRVRYVSPVRLFVFLCIAAFFVLNLVIDPEVSSGPPSQIEEAQTVAEVERLRDQTVSELQGTLENVGDHPARAGIESGITSVKRQAERRIRWLQQRDAALEQGLPAPPAPADTELQFGNGPWDAEANPLVLSWLSESGNRWLNRMIGRGQANIGKVQEEPGLLKDAFLESLPQTFFILLPLFALLLKLAYLLKRRLYMEHLIVALHSHAFLCVAVLVLAGLDQARSWLGVDSTAAAVLRALELITLVWMPLYLWLMQKRVYGQGIILTTLKFGILGLLYVLLLAFGALLNLVFNLVAL